MHVLNGTIDFIEIDIDNRTSTFLLKTKISLGYITCCKCVRLSFYQLYLETVEEENKKTKKKFAR